jgi:hypothetical protein
VRRIIAIALLSAAAMASPAEGKAPPTRFSPESLLDALAVKDTDPDGFDGAYEVIAGSHWINWYFANLGLYAFVSERRVQVLKYLNLYIAKSQKQPNHTINDAKFDQSAKKWVECPADSNDAYAATFLSLAVEYRRQTGAEGDVWFRANLPAFKAIAYANLASPQSDNPTRSGMIPAYRRDYAPPTHEPVCPRFTRSNAAYTQDNAENYRGLMDFAQALQAIGDADAQYYEQIAQGVAAGIQGRYDGQAFAFMDATPEAFTSTEFHLQPATQVFPQLCDVPLTPRFTSTQEGYTKGYAYLNAHSPNWSTQIVDGNGKGFPWMLLGYVAAKRHDDARAQNQMALLRANLDKATINELGFYKRILNAGISDR